MAGFKSRTAGVIMRTYAKSKQNYDFEFTASETDALVVMLSQDEKLISTTITRDAAGIYAFTFPGGERFKRIYGHANVGKTGDWVGNVHTVVDGNAVNSFKVETTTGGAGDDPEAPVNVRLALVHTEVN